jgi:hypothetical protein
MFNTIFLVMLVGSILLFFWGIYKALKTAQNKYAWAMLPFFVLMGFMFIH